MNDKEKMEFYFVFSAFIRTFAPQIAICPLGFASFTKAEHRLKEIVNSQI